MTVTKPENGSLRVSSHSTQGVNTAASQQSLHSGISEEELKHGTPENGLNGTNGDSTANEIDWKQVLSSLQREKKRAVARAEEQYVNRSLFCLENSSKLREALIKVVEKSWFNGLILLLILANCVFLVFEDPVCKCAQKTCTANELYKQSLYLGLDCSGWPATEAVLEASEYTFTALFATEMVIKIVARGFILHKHAYLRDAWNWIDFIVVIASLLSLAPSSGTNVQFLRTIRVLRPLRTMTRIKGMQPLINTLMLSIQKLTNVVSLLLFFFIVYGILGIDLLSGKQRGRCFVDPTNNVFPPGVYSQMISQQNPFIIESRQHDICTTDTSAVGGYGCDSVFIQGMEYNVTCTRKKWCHTDWCKNDWNPNLFDLGAGYFSYDDIGQAFLVIFQVLSNEGWIDFLYAYEAGWSIWASRVFHVSWVLIGSFFVIQLALAVLADSFVQAQDDEKSEKEREALHNEAILRQKDRDGKQSEAADDEASRLAKMVSQIKNAATSVDLSKSFSFQQEVPVVKGTRNAWHKMTSLCRQLVLSQYFQNFIVGAIILNTITMALTRHEQHLFEDQICKNRCNLDPELPASASEHCTGRLFNSTFIPDGTGGGMRPPQVAFCFLQNDADFEFEQGSRYYGASCSTAKNWDDCVTNPGIEDLGCHWVGPSKDKGDCRLGLYTPEGFAKEAQIGVDGKVGTLSLRHICGDGHPGTTQCSMFNEREDNVLEQINEVLTGVFIGEMILKWMGLGFAEYFADSFNQFDCFVVMSSIVELVAAASSGSGGGNSSVSALRGMRLFRLFKLARSWKDMRKILHTLAVALSSMGSLAIVWMMFIYIIALLAMQFFGGKFKFVKTDAPRSNFDAFGPSNRGHGAFVIIFQIITTENFNTIMYNCVTAEDPFNPAAALLTIMVVLFGNYIIINLFISILLQGFDEEEGDDEDEEDPEAGRGPTPRLSKAQRVMNAFRKLLGQKTKQPVAPNPLGLKLPAATSDVGAIASRLAVSGHSQSVKVGKITNAPMEDEDAKAIAGRMKLPDVKDLMRDEEEGDVDEEGLDRLVTIHGFYHQKPIRIPDHRAFFVFGRNHPLRVAAAAIVQHPIFENMILVCICITTVTLLIERPDDQIVEAWCPQPPEYLDCSQAASVPGQIAEVNCARDATDPDFGRVWGPCDDPIASNRPACCIVAERVQVIQVMDMVFTFIFTAEMTLKMLSDGLILHPHAYGRSAWNWLDFFIVVVSLLSAFGPASALKSLKALRAVRALRPLRVIKRYPELKVAVNCLLSSIPAMIQVCVVVLLWFSMYAMLGVQFFRGGFYSCYDLQNQVFYGTAPLQGAAVYEPNELMAGPDSVPTIIECVAAGPQGGLGVWTDKPYSFDNFLRGLLTLFEMATTEGWLDVMAGTTDMLGAGITPIPNFRPWYAIYSVCHIVIGSFVLLNLIVGSVINNYNKIKAQNDNIGPFLTAEQQEWKETQRLIMHLKPQRRRQGPVHPIRNKLFQIAESEKFEYAITVVILLNVVSMVVKHYNQSDCFTAALFYCNCIFCTIFIAEAIVKIVGLGPKWYIYDPWNAFDFVVVLFSIVTIVLDTLNQEYACGVEKGEAVADVPGLGILRVFRIARVFRLVRRLKGLRQQIETLIISLPSLGNIAALLTLMIVIFALLGVTFFYNVNLEQDGEERMDSHANYFHLDAALFSLFRQTTGEAWNSIMYYTMNMNGYFNSCEKTYEDYYGDGCGEQYVGIFFHIGWQLLGTYVMMQLFTAVILENFHEMTAGDISTIPIEKLNEFVDVWHVLDPEAEELIPVARLPELISNLSPPMGLYGKLVSRNALMAVIKDLQIPIRKGKVQYKDTFVACVKRVLADGHEDDEANYDDEEDMESPMEPNGAGETEHRGPSSFSGSAHFRGRRITAAEDFAARAVQKAFREWREKKIQVVKAINLTLWIPINGEADDFVTQ